MQDSELLMQFRVPATKEKSLYGYNPKIPGKTLLAHSSYGGGTRRCK